MNANGTAPKIGTKAVAVGMVVHIFREDYRVDTIDKQGSRYYIKLINVETGYSITTGFTGCSRWQVVTEA